MPAELYGPFGALVVLSFVLLAIIRGDLVPGWLYKKVEGRVEKAEEQARLNAESLTALAKAAASGTTRGTRERD